MPKWIEVDESGVGWEVDFSPDNDATVYSREVTTKRQLPPQITNFCCPLCGSKKFEAIHELPEFPPFTKDTLIGPGDGQPQLNVYRIIEYRCPKCTVRFDDPAKFSKNQPADVVAPVPTSHEQISKIR